MSVWWPESPPCTKSQGRFRTEERMKGNIHPSKVTIIGAGNVGAIVAFALSVPQLDT